MNWEDGSCQVQVYSGRGSSQVQMKTDEGGGQRAGQEVSLARVGDHLDSTTKDNECLIPCIGSSQDDGDRDRQKLE